MSDTYSVLGEGSLIDRRVTGGGSGVPTDTVDIVQAYTINPDFLAWNLYDGRDQTTFTPPGPPVYNGGGAGTPAPAPSVSASESVVPSVSVSASIPGSSEASTPSNTVVPTPEESAAESTVPVSSVAATTATGSASDSAQPS